MGRTAERTNSGRRVDRERHVTKLYEVQFGDDHWFQACYRQRTNGGGTGYRVNTQGIVEVLEQVAKRAGRTLDRAKLDKSLEIGELFRVFFSSNLFTDSIRVNAGYYFPIDTVQRGVNTFLEKLLQVHQGSEVEQLFVSEFDVIDPDDDDDINDKYEAYRRPKPSEGPNGPWRQDIVAKLKAQITPVIADLTMIVQTVISREPGYAPLPEQPDAGDDDGPLFR